MRIFVILLLGIFAVSAVPKHGQRIVGGSVTSIDKYPEMASLLFPFWSGFQQICGGTVLNNRAILTAAHCTVGYAPGQWRARLGSSYANSGGTVYFALRLINHPHYNPWLVDNDVSIIHTTTAIQFSDVIKPGSIAGPNYHLADNEVVWAAGWGVTSVGGQQSEELRHVQVYSINQEVCRDLYETVATFITDNMLCSGVLGVGGRDQCQGDSGGPLFHNGVVVGVCSFGKGCAEPEYPGVNARVSRFTSWIIENTMNV